MKVDTPRSPAISVTWLLILAGGLYLLPSLSNGGQSKTWAYLVLGAVGIVMSRAARSSMSMRPEIDDRLLPDADRRLKPKLKVLLYTLGFAWFVLVVIAIEDSFRLFSRHTVIVVTTVGISYLAATIAGYIYRWKFVA